MMKAGLPANLVSPPSSQGAGQSRVAAFESWPQRPVTTVARPSGMDAAWSKEMLAGIWGGDRLSEPRPDARIMKRNNTIPWQ